MMNEVQYFKHSSAIIDDGAIIGKDTKIWHFCHIMQANIGSNCILGQNVFVANNVKIGNNVKIQNNVSVFEGVTIEDDVFIGPSVVFTNVNNPRSFIERKEEYKHTLVKKGATIGANATIVCGYTIGEYAFIGAGSVVTRNINNFELVIGNPARQKYWVCKCAEPLHFENNEAFCAKEQKTYILESDIVRIKE